MRKCDNASTQSVRETSGAQWLFPPLTSPLWRGRREPSRLSSKGLPASQQELDWPGQGRARQPKQFFFFSLTTGVPLAAAAAISNDRLFFCTPTHTHSHRNTAHILFLRHNHNSDLIAAQHFGIRSPYFPPLPVRRKPDLIAKHTRERSLFTPVPSSFPIVHPLLPRQPPTNRQNECCR